MLGGRIRNGKPRILVFTFVGVVMLLGIYVLRDTHIKLNNARSSFERCEQQQESLSAQLQVVYEHKSRLEKSLQQEKASHKKNKDDILAQYQELQDVKEKEKQEAGNRFNSIQQQHKMLQIQNEDLQEELNKVQQSNIKLIQDKQKLQDTLDENDEIIKNKDLFNAELKAKILALQQEIELLANDVADKDTKLKELAMHVNLCDAKLDALRLDKFSAISDTNAIKTERGNKIVDGEHKLGSKILDYQRKPVAPKLDSINNSVLKIGRNNKNNEHVNNVGVLTPQSVKPEEKLMQKSDFSNQAKESNANLLTDKRSNDQDGQNVPGGSNALPRGMGRRTGYLGHPSHQLEVPNHMPPQEETFDAVQQLAVPDTRNLNQKSYEHDDTGGKIPAGRVEEFQGNGLEQQENGGDQDLDNMEEGDGAGGHPPKEDKEEGKAFDDADFDQVPDDGGDILKKADMKQESVAVAPI